uniref:Gram domain containing protein n=1 Tax=Echinococcus granulosus TaxID=6210 RepID=A0A068WQF4_ECHGR|nr:gram domain containing protein [Echinococcus granulosus]
MKGSSPSFMSLVYREFSRLYIIFERYGKLYVTSNFLCFVESKLKNLQVVIRLEDVESYETHSSGVNIYAYNQKHSFTDFVGESGVAFLSNYLRLTKKPNPVGDSGVSSKPSFRQSPVLVNEKASNPLLPIEPPTKPSRSKNGLSARQSVSPADPLAFKSITGDGGSSGGLSTISDVAYKASCIPLLLLTRILSFAVAMATSSLQATPFGFQPPRAFTKFIAYIVPSKVVFGGIPISVVFLSPYPRRLAFLTISVVYLCYRLQHIPLDDSVGIINRNTYVNSNEAGEGDCRNEFLKIVASLQSLSQALQRAVQPYLSGFYPAREKYVIQSSTRLFPIHGNPFPTPNHLKRGSVEGEEALQNLHSTRPVTDMDWNLREASHHDAPWPSSISWSVSGSIRGIRQRLAWLLLALTAYRFHSAATSVLALCMAPTTHPPYLRTSPSSNANATRRDHNTEMHRELKDENKITPKRHGLVCLGLWIHLRVSMSTLSGAILIRGSQSQSTF